MKNLCLLGLLAISMTFGSYAYAQKSAGKNCVNVYSSGIGRSNSYIEIDASNKSPQAKNLEALHKAGYFYKEVNEEVKQLSFGETKKYTVIKYTITDLGKKHRVVKDHDLVNETWSFCK